MSKTCTLNIRMSDMEAAEKYPDSYILMQFDDMASNMGTVLAVCDTDREAWEKLALFDDLDILGVVEGMNHRRSLGGIVVGG